MFALTIIMLSISWFLIWKGVHQSHDPNQALLKLNERRPGSKQKTRSKEAKEKCEGSHLSRAYGATIMCEGIVEGFHYHMHGHDPAISAMYTAGRALVRCQRIKAIGLF